MKNIGKVSLYMYFSTAYKNRMHKLCCPVFWGRVRSVKLHSAYENFFPQQIRPWIVVPPSGSTHLILPRARTGGAVGMSRQKGVIPVGRRVPLFS